MMSNWKQASVLSVTHMQKSAHAMLLAYDTNSVQEYSRRTDKWKKAVREQTCSLQLQMIMFFFFLVTQFLLNSSLPCFMEEG